MNKSRLFKILFFVDFFIKNLIKNQKSILFCVCCTLSAQQRIFLKIDFYAAPGKSKVVYQTENTKQFIMKNEKPTIINVTKNESIEAAFREWKMQNTNKRHLSPEEFQLLINLMTDPKFDKRTREEASGIISNDNIRPTKREIDILEDKWYKILLSKQNGLIKFNVTYESGGSNPSDNDIFVTNNNLVGISIKNDLIDGFPPAEISAIKWIDADTENRRVNFTYLGDSQDRVPVNKVFNKTFSLFPYKQKDKSDIVYYSLQNMKLLKTGYYVLRIDKYIMYFYHINQFTNEEVIDLPNAFPSPVARIFYKYDYKNKNELYNWYNVNLEKLFNNLPKQVKYFKFIFDNLGNVIDVKFKIDDNTTDYKITRISEQENFISLIKEFQKLKFVGPFMNIDNNKLFSISISVFALNNWGWFSRHVVDDNNK